MKTEELTVRKYWINKELFTVETNSDGLSVVYDSQGHRIAEKFMDPEELVLRVSGISPPWRIRTYGDWRIRTRHKNLTLIQRLFQLFRGGKKWTP